MNSQEVIYIYPDIAFTVSLIMNGLILWGTSRFNKRKDNWLRITIGALIGACYSFAAAFPKLHYLETAWLKILFSFVMVWLTFGPVNFKSFLTLTTLFYGTSFFLGGLFFGLLFFLSSSPYYYHLYDLSVLIGKYFIPILVISPFIFVIWSLFMKKFIQNRVVQNVFMIPIKVSVNGHEVTVDALLDTGNSLVDPLSRVPVIVVEYGAIKGLFTCEIQRALENNCEDDYMSVLDSVSGTIWSTKFRIVPFTSVGRETGLLLGFRPDLLEVLNTGNKLVTSDVVVAIYSKILSPEGRYRALLHPDLLQLNTA